MSTSKRENKLQKYITLIDALFHLIAVKIPEVIQKQRRRWILYVALNRDPCKVIMQNEWNTMHNDSDNKLITKSWNSSYYCQIFALRSWKDSQSPQVYPICRIHWNITMTYIFYTAGSFTTFRSFIIFICWNSLTPFLNWLTQPYTLHI